MKHIILIVLFLFVNHLLSAQLNNGLIGKYYFNYGSASDDLGSVNGIENNTTLTTDRFGCSNQAYHFNPADTSFITLGDNFDAAITGASAKFSISVWFKRTNLNQKNEFLLAKFGNPLCSENQRQFLFRIDNTDKLNFTFYTALTSNNYRDISGSTIILDTAWHHAVVNYDGTLNGNNGLNRVTLFLDGVQETTVLNISAGTLGPIQNGTGHLAIGASVSSSGTYCGAAPTTGFAFSGDLDDIRIYNRNLSSSEITALYNEVSNCTVYGLVAKYYFNHGNANDDLGIVHGTENNVTLATDRFGCPNQAYHFNPADSSFISLGDNFDAFLTSSNAKFSISIWFRRTDLNQKNEYFLAKFGNTLCGEDQREFLFRIGANDKLDFTYFTGLGINNYRDITGSTAILDTLWHHALVNYDGSTSGNNGLDRVMLYLDGVQETVSMLSAIGLLGPIQNGTGHVAIGASVSSSGTYCGVDPTTGFAFSGDLDDIRIYNTTLDNSEITTLYNETDTCLVRSGLVAKYYFDNGNANDDLGNIDGIVNNATLTTNRFGCPNEAYHFNGADSSFITLGDNFDDILVGQVAQFSFSIWFKRTDLNQKNEFLLAKFGNPLCGEDQREFLFRIDQNDKLNFTYYTDLGQNGGIYNYRIISGNTTILDTFWHHALVNYNGSTSGNNGLDRVMLYLDGVQETVSMLAVGALGPIINGTAHIAIGASASSYGNYCGLDPTTDGFAFTGDLDDIRIYDQVLDLTEILALYNETDSCSILGFNSISPSKEIFKLYPNPTSQNLTIELLDDIENQNFVEIYNTQGQLVQQIGNISTQKSQTIDVKMLASGLYHVVLKDKKGMILHSLRFVKN